MKITKAKLGKNNVGVISIYLNQRDRRSLPAYCFADVSITNIIPRNPRSNMQKQSPTNSGESNKKNQKLLG